MTALTPAQIAFYAQQAGVPPELLATKTAIALAESSGRPTAFNNNAATGDSSRGLWQINMIGNLGPERRKQFGISFDEELFDPAVNARAAKQVYDSQGLGAWSVYKSGKYKDFLPQAQEGVKQLMGGNVELPPPAARPGAGAAGGMGAVGGTFQSMFQQVLQDPPRTPEAATALAGLGASFAASAGLAPRGSRMAASPEYLGALAGSRGGDAMAGEDDIAKLALAAVEALSPGVAGGRAHGAGAASKAATGGGGADLVALGRALEGAGLRVREHPEFGDGRVGRHSPGSLHYSGKAIDVTDWQDPGESEKSWRPRKAFLGSQIEQILGSSAQVLHPGNDPRGHGTHIHIGLPSGQISPDQVSQLVQARQEALKRYPLRWAG